MGFNLNVTIIITTYNWPEALRLTLQSIVGQSMDTEQIVVADDGSGPETEQVIKGVLGSSDLRWCHVRHEDKKVRQSRIKNLAVKYSDRPYLIFIDHDTVLHPCFIADHLEMAEKGCFLQGKRVLLPGHYTERVLTDKLFAPPSLGLPGLGNRKNTFRVPFIGKLFSTPRNFQTSLRGCNLSMFKSDFLMVDGFDETFDQSWGREDSDICYRLFHCGVRVKNLWFSALQYHLKHTVFTNWEKERLDSELLQNIKEKRVKALKGFSRLSPEGEIIATSDDY